ncbi:MAG: hypothetical protein WBF81_03075 [Thermoplasmata archaeon]
MDEEPDTQPPEEISEFARMSRGRRLLLVLIILGGAISIIVLIILLLQYSTPNSSLEPGALPALTRLSIAGRG